MSTFRLCHSPVSRAVPSVQFLTKCPFCLRHLSVVRQSRPAASSPPYSPPQVAWQVGICPPSFCRRPERCRSHPPTNVCSFVARWLQAWFVSGSLDRIFLTDQADFPVPAQPLSLHEQLKLSVRVHCTRCWLAWVSVHHCYCLGDQLLFPVIALGVVLSCRTSWCHRGSLLVEVRSFPQSKRLGFLLQQCSLHALQYPWQHHGRVEEVEAAEKELSLNDVVEVRVGARAQLVVAEVEAVSDLGDSVAGSLLVPVYILAHCIPHQSHGYGLTRHLSWVVTGLARCWCGYSPRQTVWQLPLDFSLQ